jgi:hypothetical protein
MAGKTAYFAVSFFPLQPDIKVAEMFQESPRLLDCLVVLEFLAGEGR